MEVTFNHFLKSNYHFIDMHHVDQNHMDIRLFQWMDDMDSKKKKSKATEKFVASVSFSTVSPGAPCGWHAVVSC